MRSSNRQREGGPKCSSLGCHFQLVQREGILILFLLVRGKVRTFVEENEQEKLGCCGICVFLYVYKFTLFVSLIYSVYINNNNNNNNNNNDDDDDDDNNNNNNNNNKNEKLIHFFFLPAIRRPQSVSTCN